MFERLEKIEGDFGEKDISEVKAILGNPSMLRALREVYREANEKTAQLASMDLISEEGRARAVKQQGHVAGMLRALEIVMEMSNG